MTEKVYTINDLFSDSGSFNEEEVIKALQPLLTIEKTTNIISFKDVPSSAFQKILAYALAKKLLQHKKIIEASAVSAQEVHEKTGLKKGTIDPTFKVLREKGFFIGKKDYEIPSYKIQEVIKILTNKN